MSFKIIDGGRSETPNQSKENLTNKIEQLKVFVAHMRSLERTIASIKTMAVKIEWTDLDKRLTSCHDQILDTLSYVKKSTKGKELLKDDMDKPPSRNHLKVVELKDKE